MTKIVGITGGIGSGKSTLSNYLKKNGFLVHESDTVVSLMYNNPSIKFIDFIKKCGLKEALNNKRINKKFIAKKIFTNSVLKNKYEKYIHKEVRLQREDFIKKNIKKNKKVIFLDVPLLLENKLEKKFNLVLCIISTKKNRTNRVLSKNKFSKEILYKIFKNQTTDKVRRARSNVLISNNKTKKDFICSAKRVLIKILK